MIKKSLKELSLNITEEEYRELPQLSYSALARYEKGGFAAIPHLYDKVEGEALTFGSMVDTIITEGMDRFKEKFAVVDFKLPSESIEKIADILFDYMLANNLHTLEEVSDEVILDACNQVGYNSRLKDTTRIEKIKTEGTMYCNAKMSGFGKIMVSSEVYQEVLATVGALKNSPQSANYLKQTDEKAGIEFLYQQKFCTELNGLPVKCMMD